MDLSPYISSLIDSITLIGILVCGLLFCRGVLKRAKEDNVIIAYLFLGGVIIVIAIMIFSNIYCTNETILDFASLASAIISIILALVTIIYSFYTNGQSSSQIKKLNEAAKDVTRASQDYSKSAKSLHDNINLILESIKHVEDNTKLILDAKENEQSRHAEVQKLDSSSFDMDKYLTSFVITSSNLGLLCLYAAICSKEKEQEFPLTLLQDAGDNAEYSIGYIVASNSTSIIDVNIDFKNRTALCKHYMDKLKPTVIDCLQMRKKNQFITQRKAEIDAFFATVASSEPKDEK